MSATSTLSAKSSQTSIAQSLSSFSDALTLPDEGSGFCLKNADLSGMEWVKLTLPRLASAPFAPRMVDCWTWFNTVEPGVYQPARVEIWPRGGAKSSTMEAGTTYLGTRLARRFVLYVCHTQDQSDSHIQNIARMLTDAGASPQLNKFGRPNGWRRNQLRTDNGFNVAGFGLDAGQRGIRIDEYRPDLIIFDDVDNRHDSPYAILKKIECITQTILPTGSPDCIVLFAQNIIHANSIANQLVTERADFLLDREIATVEPAILDLVVETIAREGRKPLYRIVSGTPTWEGQNLEISEQQINKWGLEAFMRESQHEVRAGSSFFDTYDDNSHASYPEFTTDNPPPRWWTFAGGIDWGYAAPFAFTLFGIDDKGKKHAIESCQDSRLTNEQQAERVKAIIEKWGIGIKTCMIGFDASMQNRPSVNGITGEAPIEAFYRTGLRCVPVSNSPHVQTAGWGVIREMLRIPGDPSPEITFWRGYNADLMHAIANATHDKMEPEKLNHDECSHLAQAMRYTFAARPKDPKFPKSEQTLEQLQAEIDRDFADQDLENRNRRLGLVKKKLPNGGFEWVPNKHALRR